MSNITGLRQIIEKNRRVLYTMGWSIITVLMLNVYISDMHITYYAALKIFFSFLIIAILTMLLGRRIYTNVLVHVIIFVILLGNALYFRYFSSYFAISSLSNAGYLEDISSSILELLRITDFLYLIWTVLSILMVYKFYSMTINHRAYLKLGATLIISSLIFFSVLPQSYQTSISKETLMISMIPTQKETINLSPIVDFDAEELGQILAMTIEQPDYYGLGENRNLIIIQVESLQNMLLNQQYNGQSITPNLNKLMTQDTLYFSNIYQQLGTSNTADAEWVTNNSLYAPMSGKAYVDYLDVDYNGLPWLMKQEGYTTVAMHGNNGDFWNREVAYPGQGYDDFVSLEDFVPDEILGLGLSDFSFFRQAGIYLQELKQPYYTFLVTLTSHHPFKFVEDGGSFLLKEEDVGSVFGQYLQSINYTDAAIGAFVDDLKERDLYEDSVIVIYGDHFGLNPNDAGIDTSVSQFLDYDYDMDTAMNIPLLIHIPGSNVTETSNIVGGQIDIMPTIENLMAIDHVGSYQLGQDLLNPIREGIVASQTYMLKGSFIDAEKTFEMSRDGIFDHSRAWLIDTHEEIDVEACRVQYEQVIQMIAQSEYILENNMVKNRSIGVGNTDLKVVKDVPKRPRVAVDLTSGVEDAIDLLELLENSTEDGNYLFKVEMNDDNKLMLMEWLREHPEVRLITEIQIESVVTLRSIRNTYQDVFDQLIPQIYVLDDYVQISYMGYSDILLNIENSEYTDDQIIDFVQLHELYAVTMSRDRWETSLGKRLRNQGVFVYITGNEKEKDTQDVGFYHTYEE